MWQLQKSIRSIYGEIKLLHTMPKGGADPFVDMEWKAIFEPIDPQLVYGSRIGNSIA